MNFIQTIKLVLDKELTFAIDHFFGRMLWEV